MDARELVERVYDHVETGDVDKAVMVCLRLARKLGDTFNIITFLRELYPDRHQLNVEFHEETQNLKKESQEFLWKTTQNRWLEERSSISNVSVDIKEDEVLAMGVSELVHEIERMEKTVDDIVLPQGMSEYDTAAFTDNNIQLKAKLRQKIFACRIVLERVKTRCLSYATRIEKQIETTDTTSNYMSSLENDVHNYYAERCQSVYLKLRKAASLIGSKESEDQALLLTEIRRAVNAVADYHFPPNTEPIVCKDGNTRVLGVEQYLNRLHEFCYRLAPSDTSGKLLQAEFEYLSVFVRRLNDIASKGVHSEVSIQEAKQGLLGLYMFLSNLISKIEQKPADSMETSEST